MGLEMVVSLSPNIWSVMTKFSNTKETFSSPLHTRYLHQLSYDWSAAILKTYLFYIRSVLYQMRLKCLYFVHWMVQVLILQIVSAIVCKKKVPNLFREMIKTVSGRW